MIPPQTELAAARQQALAAATALVEERGPRALSLGEVASRLGVSQATLQRSFASYEALLEAMAECWYAPKIAIMEDVLGSDLPPRRKMYEFFARRFVLMRDRFRADPIAFENLLLLGEENFPVVRGYVDLADHYLAEIIGEAMGEGHFAGLSVDEALSLVNQMVSLYCNSGMLKYVGDKLSEDKLARIVDAVFDGLSGHDRGARGVTELRAA